MTIWRRKLKYRFQKQKSPRISPVTRRRRLRWISTGLALILFGWGFFKVEMRVGHLAQQAAISKLNGMITAEVNRVAEEVMSEHGGHCITKEEKDESGRVLSVSTDYVIVNRIKSALAIQTQKYLDKIDVVETTIPAGMLISDTMLTGFGIRIPIQVFATNAISVEFEDEFTSAGINQTRHHLMATVTVPARVAGVVTYEETEIVVQVPIAETILVGEVPQTYLSRIP